MGTPVDTIPYTSGGATWGDLLTAYNGVARTYDGAGNLTNDGTWSYYWQNGWELVFMTDGPTAWSFMYDANGMRTNRGFGEIIYQYVYNGSQLSQMTADGNTLNFAYDAGGVPMTVNYNGTNYYYIVNLQGDVMAIVDASGTAVVSYSYDAWGNILSVAGTMADTLGESNPLTYRSYVYDYETSFYYLQSRYYDPEVGRFINADVMISTGQGLLGNNMFAYCRNNPVYRKDTAGTWDVCTKDSADDNNPLNDMGGVYHGGTGGGVWESFTRTLKHAADGLKMASGQRDLTHVEDHHIISDKHSTKTSEYKEIADRNNYSLDHKSNHLQLQDTVEGTLIIAMRQHLWRSLD